MSVSMRQSFHRNGGTRYGPARFFMGAPGEDYPFVPRGFIPCVNTWVTKLQ